MDSTAISKPADERAESDEDLVAAALAGDEEAFEQIFERYRRLVVHLVAKFFAQRELVEELSQQAFTKIYFSLKDFRGGREKSFSSWLSRLTVNVCYDELRRRQRRPEDLFTDLGTDETDFLENLAEGKPFDNENAFETRELAEKLLAGLDPRDRLAVTLYHGEDWSIAEVAKTVGWTESNVKVRLMRTRNYLRSLFDRLG